MSILSRLPLAAVFGLLLPLIAFGQDTNTPDRAAILALAKRLEASLHYQQGVIPLKKDLATLTLSDKFRFLPPADSEIVLFKLWGNPPGVHPLGMIVPAEKSILDPDSWAIVVTYDNDGYVKDADADKINYDKMLQQMQDATHAASQERVKRGFPAIELVGWATPPTYDKTTHKMYWAKEIRFGKQEENTLNYNIRVLGRQGVLVLNAVAPMSKFSEIQAQTPEIVQMADFNAGKRYADFNGSTDKVAEYGLAALVAGGIAAKAGLFKLMLAGLFAAKKFLIVGFVAASAWIKKFFNRKKPEASPALPPPPPPTDLTPTV